MILKHLKKYVLWIVVIAYISLFGRGLNPFDSQTFSGHDVTQPARIAEFVLNLREGQFPPRISPNMSFGLGYPVFNFYAPLAYWITSGLNLLGFNIAQSLELSYLLALVAALTGMYYFLSTLFTTKARIVGAVLYVSSPFVAVDIFVRGNLAELWFLAVFPWTFYLLATVTKRRLFITSLITASVLSSHNIFSLLSVPILLFFSTLQKNKLAVIAVFLGLMMASSFLIPAVGELNQVQASKIATITEYQDHFLCISQLWFSQWGFGGSAPECVNDGMSFMLGKLHILAGLGGLMIFIWDLIKRKKDKNTNTFVLGSIAILLVGSIFMTIDPSKFIWEIFNPILSIFQFPWRFLLFGIFGLAVFGAFLIERLPRMISMKATLILMIGVIILSPKFFAGNPISVSAFLKEFTSDSYIREKAAFNVAEYLPISAIYDVWRTLEFEDTKIPDNPIGFKPYEIQISENTILPLHYAPYWYITIDGKPFKPTSFDSLGRPRILVKNKTVTVSVKYQQTPLEQLANGITLLTGIMVFIYSRKSIWHTKKT